MDLDGDVNVECKRRKLLMLGDLVVLILTALFPSPKMAGLNR